jgi:hypothetical protein
LSKGNLGFGYRVTKSGGLLIMRNGKLLSTVSGSKAETLIGQLNALAFAEQQQFLARQTGNYKRGNERQSKNHPRNS